MCVVLNMKFSEGLSPKYAETERYYSQGNPDGNSQDNGMLDDFDVGHCREWFCVHAAMVKRYYSAINLGGNSAINGMLDDVTGWETVL